MVLYKCSKERNTKEIGKENPSQTRKGIIMKKTTMQFIAAYLNDNVPYADDVERAALESAIAELNIELNRGAEAKARKASEYEQAKEIVLEVLRMTTKPLTVAEIFDECEKDLPEGFTKNKVNYGLTHYWTDEVVKTEGKVNSYQLKERA